MSEGRAHRGLGSSENQNGSSEGKKNFNAKKVAAVAGAVTLAAAAAYVAANPNARAFVANAAKSIGKLASKKTSLLAAKGKSYAKKAAKQAKEGLKEGVKEGLKEGPKKLAKATIIGAIMYGGKKALDKAVGSDTSGRIMKANDKKKIGSFWQYLEPDKKDDDDDD